MTVQRGTSSTSSPNHPRAERLRLDPNNDNIAFVGTANHNQYPAASSTNSGSIVVGGGIWMTTNLQSGTNSTWTYLGDGNGAAATATTNTNTGQVTGFTSTSGGSGYALEPGTNTTVGVLFNGGLDSTGVAATATAIVTGGAVSSVTLTNDGTGYTSAPTVTFYSQSVDAQPSRMLNSTGTATGSIQTFSADHPIQLFVLNSSATNGATVNVVAVMAIRNGISSVDENAGVWSGTGTLSNGAYSWTWADMSGDTSSSTVTGTGPGTGTAGTNGPTEGGENEIPYYMVNLTIDPNVSSQQTWFATMSDVTSGNADEIYETTNAGTSWFVYSTFGQATSFWIEPGEQRRSLAPHSAASIIRRTTKRPIQRELPIRNSIWTRIFHLIRLTTSSPIRSTPIKSGP